MRNLSIIIVVTLGIILSGCRSTYKVTKKNGSVEYIRADGYHSYGYTTTFWKNCMKYKTLQAESIEKASSKEMKELELKKQASK